MHPSNDGLLSLVDRLSQPHKSAVIVEDDDGTEQKVYIQHDALLKQLRELVHSSLGSSVQGAGLASERNVIDADALDYYEALSRQIRRLYSEVSDSKPFPDPESNLRQWFIQFAQQATSRKVSDSVIAEKTKKVASMVYGIESKLNPPTVLEITAPCPRCGASHATDEQGVYRRAILIESRVVQYRSLENTKARCIACLAVWLHGRGMRQLRYEIDHTEEMRHAEDEKPEQMFEDYGTLVERYISVPKNETGP